MKQFPYLVIQTLLTLAYLIFRFLITEESELSKLKDLELKSLGVFGFVLIIRLIRVESWLGYFIFALKLAHIIMCGLMFQFDKKLAICFGVLAILIHFGIEPPFFEVTQRVATLTEYLVQPYIETVPECYILFYTTWENLCVSVTPIFLNISEKYSTNDILFARFDIGRSKPEFEEKYKVSARNGTLKQIPTIIHYKGGKEINRLNPALLEGKIMNYPNIVKYFKLSLPKKENEKKK